MGREESHKTLLLNPMKNEIRPRLSPEEVTIHDSTDIRQLALCVVLGAMFTIIIYKSLS